VSMWKWSALPPGGRPCPPYIGRRTRSVDRSPGRLQQGNLSLVCLHHGRLIRATLIRLDFLDLYAKLFSCLDKVVGGIFWKVFRRSCGPPTRSVGPTDKIGRSSSRPDPLVGDDREPGRWGSKGTHVSHLHFGTNFNTRNA
jgi:hypothetical protein